MSCLSKLDLFQHPLENERTDRQEAGEAKTLKWTTKILVVFSLVLVGVIVYEKKASFGLWKTALSDGFIKHPSPQGAESVSDQSPNFLQTIAYIAEKTLVKKDTMKSLKTDSLSNEKTSGSKLIEPGEEQEKFDDSGA